MNQLDAKQARIIIESVGSGGLPPESGFQYFTAGLEPYLNCLDSDYLSSFIKEGGSAFKLVTGVYGGGKTHFLYCIRELAWKHNFAVSYVVLSPDSTPFHKLELVYKEIANTITPPLDQEELLSGYEKGIRALLQRFYMHIHEQCDNGERDETEVREGVAAHIESLDNSSSLSFAKAVKSALLSLNRQDEDSFTLICQWLNGEGYIRKEHSRFDILEKIDKTTASKMIHSMSQMLRAMGFSGLVILFDEAEQKSSMSTKQRGILQSNLRELIDSCGHSDFKSIMIFYAVPDLSFLEGTTQVYEALKQRLSTVYDDINPTGVRIDLEKSVKDAIPFLTDVGKKLARVYEIAYKCELPRSELDETLNLVASHAYGERFGDTGYKRLFVKLVVSAFHLLRSQKTTPTIDKLRGLGAV